MEFKKCADDASKKGMDIMRKEMADIVKSMSEDVNEIKTALAQEATKLVADYMTTITFAISVTIYDIFVVELCITLNFDL